MKKILLTIACIVLALLSITGRDLNEHLNVVKPQYGLYVPIGGVRLLPYKDYNTDKIGFVRNMTTMTIMVPAQFDDCNMTHKSLVAVKKNGKWGVVDLEMRNIAEQPIVPCIYNRIEIVDDDIVICDGKRIDINQRANGQ